MRFLIDANMPRSTEDLIKGFGHDAIDVRDRGMGASPDRDIAALAKREGLIIITRDKDFGDVRAYPPEQFAGIVVLDLPPFATAPFVLRHVEGFLRQSGDLALRSHWLAIVEPGHMRLRFA